MGKLLIKNGKIFDGTGRPWYMADLLIKDNKIEKIRRHIEEEAEKVIDAKGLAVAPGFWDLHTHDDFVIAMKENPSLLECRIRSGVTTLVGGNCGYSPHPVTDEYLGDLRGYTAFLDPGISYKWRDLKGYFEYLEKQGIVCNYATNFGQGAVRTAVMGLGDIAPANDEQLQKMKDHVAKEMEQGAFGMSTGLLYPPGQFTQTEELVELAKVVAEYGGVYLSHLRNESALWIDALKEAITVGRKAGLRVQIHHHEAFGDKYFWKMRTTLELMREARELKDLDISFDFIPYTGDNTTILAIFPSWAFAGGLPKLLERLKDPKQVKKMREHAETYVPTWFPVEVYPHNVTKASAIDSKNKYDNILILWCNSKENKKLEGLTLAELGKKRRKHPYDATAELAAQEKGAVMLVYFGGTGQPELGWQKGTMEPKTSWFAEGKIDEIKHPFSSIESDAILGKEKQSPAAWGTTARTIGRFAREMGLITMEEAVKKITFNPAGVLKVNDSGMICEGNYGDITIFNQKTTIDKATWKEARAPEGIEYVIVNGTVVLERGEYHKKRLEGRIIKSTSYY